MFFTVSEVAAVLRGAEKSYALTARGIRYYARTGMVRPTGRLRATKRSRSTRLYDVVDVALLRLICRLHRQRAHERAIWGLLIYRGEELRRQLVTASGEIVVTDRGALGIGSEDAKDPKPIRIDVASLLSGLTERLEAYRRREPEIWTGLAWVPATEAANELRA